MNQRRFSIPNDIWKWNLKPQGFATLAYLCYLHIHCNKGASSSADEIASQLHMSKDMAAEQLSELNHRGLLDQNIGHGVITVYAYLLYCEDRRTHQCHPSYRTISDVVHLTVSTVMKHITKLADRQFITVESTSYIDKRGMKWNGNNLYTILPIQMAMDYCYQQQLLRLEA